jgi:hypothetical protein
MTCPSALTLKLSQLSTALLLVCCTRSVSAVTVAVAFPDVTHTDGFPAPQDPATHGLGNSAA